jgi:hypothetical protein
MNKFNMNDVVSFFDGSAKLSAKVVGIRLDDGGMMYSLSGLPDQEYFERLEHDLELCVAVKPGSVCSKIRHGISHWDTYSDEGRSDSHVVAIENCLSGSGQLFVGMLDFVTDEEMVGLTCEINTMPLDDGQPVPCVHVHFNNSEIAVSLFKVGNKFLVRPETGVSITHEMKTVHGHSEDVFWIEPDQSIF